MVELDSFHVARDRAEFEPRFATVAQVHAEFLPQHYPAWSAAGTSALYAEGAPMELRAEALIGSGGAPRVDIAPPALP